MHNHHHHHLHHHHHHHHLPLLLLSLLLLPLPSTSSSSSSPSDSSSLLAFKSKADPNNLLNFTTTNHCHWPGVQCSTIAGAPRVTRLVLEYLGLNGSFPGGAALAGLDQLRLLSLKGNSLSGRIPDLSPLHNLKSIFLDHNRFSGGFPSTLLGLHRLRTIDLSYNSLSGPIPAAIAGVDRLSYLRLDSNRLNGSVPAMNQTSLKIFNVSANELSGPVPVTPVLSGFGVSCFAGNPRLCGVAVRRECSSNFLFFGGKPAGIAPSPAPTMRKQLPEVLRPSSGSSTVKLHRRVVVAVGFLAGAFLVMGVIGVSVLVKRNRMGQEKGQVLAGGKNADDVFVENPSRGMDDNGADLEANEGGGNSDLAVGTAMMPEDKVKKLGKSGCLVFCAGEAQVYSLEQLMRASAELLGRGNIGTTYKAVLDNRLIVSVKRLDAAKLGMTGKEAFERHMDVVGRLRHPNLVPLRAYFHAKQERLLVYDYQPNGSLFSLIHGSRSTRAKSLHWTSCLKIAEDVAQGLAYIHQASRLVHGNIKSSNVLLGSEFEACLTDNCLSFLVEPSEGEDELGYRAPETRKSNRRLTPRSDIYAFGVLLLELLTGKPPLQHPVLLGTDLPVWVRSVRDDTAEDERVMMLVDIAAACVRSSPDSRPTTWQVLKMIQEVKETDTGDDDMDSASLS